MSEDNFYALLSLLDYSCVLRNVIVKNKQIMFVRFLTWFYIIRAQL